MLDKITYANKRWGCTLFYVDSNGDPNVPYDPAIFERVTQALTRQGIHALLMPEQKTARYYAVTAPYAELRGGHPPRPDFVRRIYPDAFTVLNIADGPIDADHDAPRRRRQSRRHPPFPRLVGRPRQRQSQEHLSGGPTEMNTESEMQINNTTIEVVRGSVIDQDVDAIVNAANTQMRGGGGVDGAIHRAAGKGLLAELDQVVPDRAPTGTAVITGGHNLKQKHVIHTPGPVWNGGNNGEATELASSYRSCLELADQHHLSSLAFCSISTGVYGYPLDQAAPHGRADDDRLLEGAPGHVPDAHCLRHVPGERIRGLHPSPCQRLLILPSFR